MTLGLLTLPTEIRLIIFNFLLHFALSSRHNGHLRLLQTYTQIAAEAGPMVRQYLCLKDESQIRVSSLMPTGTTWCRSAQQKPPTIRVSFVIMKPPR